MKSLKLKFQRDSINKHFPHRNRASTDAYGAVVNWADPEKGRSYEVCKDEEEELEAKIFFSEKDTGAEDELVARCRKVGIECFVLN
jgi:hypothetical protein